MSACAREMEGRSAECAPSSALHEVGEVGRVCVYGREEVCDARTPTACARSKRANVSR